MPPTCTPPWTACSIALLTGVVAAACTNPATERTALAEAAATERFGEDNRRSVDIVPGVVTSIEATADPVEIVVRGTGPYPVFGVDNGVLGVFSGTLIVDNLALDATFVPTLTTLPSDGRSDPNCDSTIYTDRGDVVLAPLTPRSISGTRLTFDVEIPACSRVQVQAQPAADVEEVRIGVLAALQGDRPYLQAAITAASDLGVDHVHVLGDAQLGVDTTPYETLIEAFDAAGIPVSVSMGARDLRDGPSVFIEALGPGDFTSAIGRARFLNLDSSQHEISSPQLSEISQVADDGQPGVVVTYRSPVGLGTDRGWRSLALVGRTLEALSARSFDTVLGGGGHATAARTFAGMTHITLSHEVDALALVRIARPWPILSACDDATPCSSGTCIRGFCRTACGNETACEDACVQPPCTCSEGVCAPACSVDADCPAPAATCRDGACVMTPTIETTIEYF